MGAWLYEMGGFMLPFLIVGAISIILSLTLIVTIPNLGPPEEEEEPLIQDPTDVQLRYLNLGSMRKLRHTILEISKLLPSPFANLLSRDSYASGVMPKATPSLH